MLNKKGCEKKKKTNLHMQSVCRNLFFGTTKPRDLELCIPRTTAGRSPDSQFLIVCPPSQVSSVA